MNCSLAGSCGGCSFHKMTYEEQLAQKDERVRSLLRQVLRGDDVYEGILESPLRFAYRNKMEYSFGDSCKDGPLTLGLHRKKSFYDVIDTDDCRLVHEDFNQVVRAAASYFKGLGLTYKDKRTHRGYLRYLIVRRSVNTEEMLVDLVTTSQPLLKVEKHSQINDDAIYDAEALKNGFLKAGPETEELDEGKVFMVFTEIIRGLEEAGLIKAHIRGILHTVNDSMSDAVKNEGTEVLYGNDSITEQLLELKFRISPFSFFQTNSKSAEVLYSKLREYLSDSLKEDMTVYDLYTGTGTIAQLAAPCVKQVIGIEIVPEAVTAARLNAMMNGIRNCRFVVGDVLKELDRLEEKPDLIILDPPRDGVHPSALNKILSYGVEKILYVSCKPESLARDLVVMQAAGYSVLRAAAVDQFPWTSNVEAICLLSR